MTQLSFDLDHPQRSSLFDRIMALSVGVETESCIPWLQSQKLTRSGQSYRDDHPSFSVSTESREEIRRQVVFAQRSVRRSSADLDRIKKTQTRKGVYDQHAERIWSEYSDPSGAVRALSLNRLPVDAMAFYHPFHLAPVDEWGIYIRVDRLLNYSLALSRLLKDRVYAFSPESLLAYSLFEIFNHEFFHHLEECAATTIEILSAGLGGVKPIYWDFRLHAYESVLGNHPDTPLQEALANAYAHNALSFYSRVTLNFQVVQVKLYQAILRKYWLTEPPGYRSAQTYTGGQHVAGAAQLLAMMLGDRSVDPESLLLLAKSVLISGHSAFSHKAAVPTYFVGDAAALDMFHRMIPAPLETYANLFALSLEDTTALDLFLRDRKQREREAKKGEGKSS